MHIPSSFITSVLSAGIMATCAINAFAEPIAGSSAMNYSERKVVQVPNAEGQMLQLAQSKGTLKSPSPMDGAKVTNEEIGQLFQGNGDHSGYYTVSNNDGSTVSKWSGKVTTVMKDGNPATSFKGKWEYIGGSGKFKNIKGGGDYTGYFTSADSYVVDWKGNYKLD